MSKKRILKLIANSLCAIFAVLLAVSPGTNAADDPFIKSGKAKFIQGDYSGAIADYDRAIELNPDYVEAYNNRGCLLSPSWSDYEGAIANCDRAIELNPD